MTIEKTWDYATLTAKAEEEIRRSLEFAGRYPGNSFEHDHHISIACGVFGLWNNLTCGWQEQGDAARLELLARGLAA